MNKRGRFYFSVLVWVAFLSLTPRVLHAMTLRTYDLDSELYMAPDVVEVTLVGSHTEKGLAVSDVLITRVHQGQLKEKSQVMVAALDFFVVAKEGELNHRELRNGDQLIVFLDRAKEGFAFPVPKDAVIYIPVPGGVRIVHDGKVFRFAQRDNPGPYVVSLKAGKEMAATLETYRQIMAARIKVVDAFRAEFAAKKGDAEWVLGQLAGQLKPEPVGENMIAFDLTMAIAETKDPGLLERALVLGHHGDQAHFRITQGFATPRGREYILKAVGDERSPMERRLLLARVLPEMWAWYDLDKAGKAPADNGHYVERIAGLALENAGNKELCGTLVNGVSHLAQVVVQSKDEAIWRDWRNAEAKLTELWGRGMDESITFDLEVTLGMTDREAYGKLGTKCGGVVTRVIRCDQKSFVHTQRSSVVECVYITNIEWGGAMPERWVIVAHNLKSNAEFTTAVSPELGRGGSSTTARITLPDGSPTGRYRVWLRGTHEGKTVSEGHFADIDLD